MPQVVVYDANVLYPSTLRDVLIRVGLMRLVQPKWTEQILDEVFRNLRVNRPDLDPERLDRTRQLMNDAIRDVLAAAIHADAQAIITRNLRDFPARALRSWGVEPRHPDAFLAELHEMHPGSLVSIVTAIARAWGDNSTAADVLDRLAVEAPRAANLVRQALGDHPAA